MIRKTLRVSAKSVRYGKKIGITRREAVKNFAAGWMSRARRHPSIYHNKGINRILFVKGKTKILRKI